MTSKPDKHGRWLLEFQPALVERASAGRLPVYFLKGWNYFDDFIREVMLDRKGFIWRGQGDESWRLRSGLDRLLRESGLDPNTPAAGVVRQAHLDRFKLACRGRRGTNPKPIKDDDEWWALGQHHDLKTPLLDWTTSPFVAAYFAMVTYEGAERCGVIGVSRHEVEKLNKKVAAQYERELVKSWKGKERPPHLAPPMLRFIDPMADENYRLVSQGGLFSRAPDGMDVEEWLVENAPAINDDLFVKVTIATSERELALRSLNRMNINHLSLFPDLKGASEFSNVDLLIDGY